MIRQAFNLCWRFSSFELLKSQIKANNKQKFKVFGLLEQVHGLRTDINHKDYIEMIRMIDIKSIVSVSQPLKEQIMNNLLTAYKDEETSEEAFQLIADVYTLDETEWLRSEVKNYFYRADTDYVKLFLEVKDFIESWSYKADETMSQKLFQQSSLMGVLRERTFKFEDKSFHQILLYTYLVQSQKMHEPMFIQDFAHSFGTLSQQVLEVSDLVVLAYLCHKWQNSMGFNKSLEFICSRLDHFIEKLALNMTTLDRVLLLNSLSFIASPSKLSNIIAPLLNDKNIPKKYFVYVVSQLLQLHSDSAAVEQMIDKRIDEITSFQDCIQISLALVQAERSNSPLIRTLLGRAASHFEGVIDVLNQLDTSYLTSCCKLYQVCYTLKIQEYSIKITIVSIFQLNRLKKYIEKDTEC